MATDIAPSDPSLLSATEEITIGPNTGHVGSKNKNVGWFDKTAPDLQMAARTLLEIYAGIPEDKILEHVLAIVSI